VLDTDSDSLLTTSEFFTPYRNMDKTVKKDMKITSKEISLWMDEKKYVICWSKREAILEKIERLNKEQEEAKEQELEEAKEKPVVVVPPKPTE